MSLNAATEEHEISRTDRIDVGFDSAFLDKWFTFEKIVLVGIALILGAGLTGALGRGPLSESTVRSAGGDLTVRYERVSHNKTPAVLEVLLPSYLPSSGQIRLRLEGDLVRRARFQRIVPEPIRSQPLPQGVIVDIPIFDGSGKGKITLTQEPSSPGLLSSRISLDGGPSVEFQQIVLP